MSMEHCCGVVVASVLTFVDAIAQWAKTEGSANRTRWLKALLRSCGATQSTKAAVRSITCLTERFGNDERRALSVAEKRKRGENPSVLLSTTLSPISVVSGSGAMCCIWC